MIVNRSSYIDQLSRSKGNGLIKIITGLRRSGKSFLLKTLFRKHLLDEGVQEDHIIIIDMESRKKNAFKEPDYLTELSQAINSPSVPTAVGKCKISIEENKEKQKMVEFSK